MNADHITDALNLLTSAEETHDGAPADTNLARAQVLATIAVAEQLAKLTKLLAAQHGPSAPATDAGGQAETAPKKTPTPRLMLDDIWETPADGEWTVTDRYGHLMLSRGDLSERYDFAEQRRGPLRLVQRTGYRRTTKTASAAQLRSGMAVSCPSWDGDVPVRLLTVQALAAGGVEVTYEPLGDDAVGAGTAGPDARITLWDEIAGGAR